jgi:aminopeptidase N
MPVVRRADYRPAPYLVPRTDLTVQLFSDHALVESTLELTPNPMATGDAASLPLKGVDLQLLALLLDGEALPPEAYALHAEGLTLLSPPQRPFQLTSRVRIEPQANTSLEGLYVSDGMVTSQCEAEGFRRITFHPDRPDVLSRYRVRIEADLEREPVLLSNGNCLASGLLPEESGSRGRHYALWEDPFPKPSYLFALVAGRLEEVTEIFTTASGRPVRLRLHVEKGDEPYTAHALRSLRRAMEWEEAVYGLEYDLSEYNIVAVRHFNMGAMENKSLNLFNSKLVLADSAIATDAELERVESVIAHEYFHNWTGNRITCRDWFQLSLKEGLTVFRDQCFSADLHGHAQVRIQTAAMLRNTQFREDGGPTAHPVQPDHYEAIDNFYTTTIYEKGAEVIRVLHTLLGEEVFMRGIALYVERHDGTAATCEDFVRALQDAAEQSWAAAGTAPLFDFGQFRRWYHQAGTPTLTIRRRWRRSSGTLELEIRQATPPTPGQPEKEPLVIPLAIGLLDQAGKALEPRLVGDPPGEASGRMSPARWGAATRLLVIDQPVLRLRLEGLPPQAPRIANGCICWPVTAIPSPAGTRANSCFAGRWRAGPRTVRMRIWKRPWWMPSSACCSIPPCRRPAGPCCSPCPGCRSWRRRSSSPIRRPCLRHCGCWSAGSARLWRARCTLCWRAACPPGTCPGPRAPAHDNSPPPSGVGGWRPEIPAASRRPGRQWMALR